MRGVQGKMKGTAFARKGHGEEDENETGGKKERAKRKGRRRKIRPTCHGKKRLERIFGGDARLREVRRDGGREKKTPKKPKTDSKG